jgi:mannose-6-phosphate isomerase-like protein (cupin superfamily)
MPVHSWFFIAKKAKIHQISRADVVELVDTPVLGAGAVRRGGSSPLIRTRLSRNIPVRMEHHFMTSPEMNEVISVWKDYVASIGDWAKLVEGIEAKNTPCGPVYDIIPNPIEGRPNEGFAIADMRDIKVAEPHYHISETEIYVVISGLGKTIVGDREQDLTPGIVVVTPPETAHFTLPSENLVLAVINTPPFSPANVVDLAATNEAVRFNQEQYESYLT